MFAWFKFCEFRETASTWNKFCVFGHMQNLSQAKIFRIYGTTELCNTMFPFFMYTQLLKSYHFVHLHVHAHSQNYIHVHAHVPVNYLFIFHNVNTAVLFWPHTPHGREISDLCYMWCTPTHHGISIYIPW